MATLGSGGSKGKRSQDCTRRPLLRADTLPIVTNSASNDLQAGDRFVIQSRRGSRYQMTFLAFGPEDAGWYVRLVDGRLARLDPGRLDWSSREPLGSDPASLLSIGDLLQVRSIGKTQRGRLLERDSDSLTIATKDGVKRSIARHEISKIWILFRASDLKRADVVILRSRSGNEYEGTFQSIDEGGLIDLRLPSGDRLSVRKSRLDKDGIFVLIPLSPAQIP